MQYVLGIDIGTSGTKTVLFSADGQTIASYTGEYSLAQPRNGWAEQNPEDWWEATVQGIRYVLEKSGIHAEAIQGIGLSGQMHGLVLLDERNEILRPCIIWADQRTGEEVLAMEREFGKEKMIAITANPPMTGFTAAKLLWVKRNEEDIFKQVRHVLLPKDYIRFKLTGTYVSDVSDASGMQMMDVKNRTWSSEVLEYLGISENVLPKLIESVECSGEVTANAAAETGLAEDTRVVGGAADNAAAAIGTGIYKTGRAFTSIGTSAVVYTVTDYPEIDAEGRVHTLCASVPGKWTLMSCTQGAGLSLKWLRDRVFAGGTYDRMTSFAQEVPIGSEHLIYLPYLMGERSPHLDPDARGVFFGLSAVHGQGELVRAVMEGVAYSQKECVDIFLENGADISDMIITGGGGRSKLWRQMLADLYGVPVRTLREDEGAALGAAILAAVGCGLYASIEEACEKIVLFEEPQMPNHEAYEQYKPYYQLYKSLYPKLQDAYKTLANIGGNHALF